MAAGVRSAAAIPSMNRLGVAMPFLERALHFFFYSVFLILGLTIAAKVTTILNSPRLLHYENPVLNISELRVLVLASGVELIVIFALVRLKKIRSRAWLILWLCGVFAVYRGLAYVSPKPPRLCPCLGRLDWLGIPDNAADYLAKALLLYMFLGASLIVFYTRNYQEIRREA